MQNTVEEILLLIRGRKGICPKEKSTEQNESLERESINEEIGEKAVVQGVKHLLEESGVDNPLEYFKSFRATPDLLKTYPIQALLTKKEIKWMKKEKREKKEKTEVAALKTASGLNYPKEYVMLGHTAQINCVTLDMTETLLATGGEDGLVKTWDVGTGRLISSFLFHTSPIADLSVSHNNKLLASVDQSGCLAFWDIDRTGSVAQPVFEVKMGDAVESIEFIYPTPEPRPLEGKTKKKKQVPLGPYKVFVITGTGKTIRVALAEKKGSSPDFPVFERCTTEVLLRDIEDESFGAARRSRGKKITVSCGLWPFMLLFDMEDPEGRFYVLDTNDMLTSAVDVSSRSLKIAASTYGSCIFIWEYRRDKRSQKSNMQSRKTYKGRDLPGAWVRECIVLEDPGTDPNPSVLITDITFLSDDVTLVLTDQESNIKIIRTNEANRTVTIPKDFKICSVTPHPVLPVFFVLEINGKVKCYSPEGSLVYQMDTQLPVSGTFLFNTRGSCFYLGDLEGQMHKYALFSVLPQLPPSSEFFRDDFVFMKERAWAYGSERAEATSVSRMEQLLKICDTNKQAPTYTVLGEANSPEKFFMPETRRRAITELTVTDINIPDMAGSDEASITETGTADTGSEIRSTEIGAVVHLQLDMIDGNIFEKEYRVPGPGTNPQDPVYIVEEESDSSVASLATTGSSDELLNISDPTNTSSDPESDTSNGFSFSGKREEITERDTTDSDSPDDTSSDWPGEASEPSSSTVQSSPQTGRRRAPRRRAAQEAEPKRRKSREKTEQDADQEFTEWILQPAPKFPLLPQKGDKLVFLPSRFPGPLPDPGTEWEDMEKVCVVSVEAEKEEKKCLKITVSLERPGNAEVVLEYRPDFSGSDPFIIEEYFHEANRRRPEPGEAVYYMAQGSLCKGSFAEFVEASKITARFEGPANFLSLETGSGRITVPPYRAKCVYTTYAEPGLQRMIPVISGKKAPETKIFYAAVRKSEYPDYHQLIACPLTLSLILQRLRRLYYRTREALEADLLLVLDNCRAYNEEGSNIITICAGLIQEILSEIALLSCPQKETANHHW